MREESLGPVLTSDGSPSEVTLAMLAGTGRSPEELREPDPWAIAPRGLRGDPEPMPEHVIPVAFAVSGPDEESAVRLLVRRLAAAGLVVGGPDPRIESWSLPNHAWADGSDDEGQRLQWVQLTSPDEVIVGESEPGFESEVQS